MLIFRDLVVHFGAVRFSLTSQWSDSFGEDIADTESGSSEYGSSDEYGDESDDEFIDDDDDFNMYPPPAPKSGGK